MISGLRLTGRWERVSQGDGRHAWFNWHSVAADLEPLCLAVFEYAGEWYFDLSHPGIGSMTWGIRPCEDQAMAAAIAAAPTSAGDVLRWFAAAQGRGQKR